MALKTGVIAFSGGLDTSFLVPYAREEYALDRVITVTVNTGGFSPSDLKKIADRSKEVGANEHFSIDGQQHFYENIIANLIYGNVTRDGYPLCVGAERFTQAVKVLEVCKEKNAAYFLHGSTGAGNDQYRFDLAAYVLGGTGIQVIAPVREKGFSREYETEFLEKRKISVTAKSSNYSYNVGLWGVSIGGKETHTSTGLIPEDAWYSHSNETQAREQLLTLEFKQGQLSSLETMGQLITDPIEIIHALGKIGSSFTIGRHYHIGTSIPGKKGRIAYESPAADIIYEAHRTLEKITLTGIQISGKRQLSDELGRLIHEARYLDPFMEDICAFLRSTQRRVTGKCVVCLAPGQIKYVTADSPFNLLNSNEARYGETSEFYSGAEAKGAVKLHSLEQIIYSRTSRSE